MAGPIIEFLQERQPVRNAIRALLGRPLKYGGMNDRMAAVSDADSMQGTDLFGGVRRLQGRNQPVSQVPTRTTTAVPVAVSPAAEAARADPNRTVAAAMQKEGVSGGIGQTAPSTPAPAAVDPGTAWQTQTLATAAKERERAAASRQMMQQLEAAGDAKRAGLYLQDSLAADARAIGLEDRVRQQLDTAAARDMAREMQTLELERKHPDQSPGAEYKVIADTVSQHGVAGATAMLSQEAALRSEGKSTAESQREIFAPAVAGVGLGMMALSGSRFDTDPNMLAIRDYARSLKPDQAQAFVNQTMAGALAYASQQKRPLSPQRAAALNVIFRAIISGGR